MFFEMLRVTQRARVEPTLFHHSLVRAAGYLGRAMQAPPRQRPSAVIAEGILNARPSSGST